mmetsp:Transcript_9098/g.26161  ORF Transcript_9098/g.26161 Transcript_9098/m.26161 type:complete len:248 (-) Transcript_9098:7-750(-)
MWLKSMSIIAPMLMTALKPTFCETLQSSTDVIIAPLWLMKATLPGAGMRFAKDAFNPDVGQMMPKQFGPTMRRWPFFAMACTSSSSFAPSGPTSRKPAEMMIACFTWLSTHSWIKAGTDAAGVMITATSTRFGQAAKDLKDVMPSTWSLLGFTGNTAPPKGLLMRFFSNVRPTLPTRSVAPMTAMLSGLKRESRGWPLNCSTSSLGSNLTAFALALLPRRGKCNAMAELGPNFRNGGCVAASGLPMA